MKKILYTILGLIPSAWSSQQISSEAIKSVIVLTAAQISNQKSENLRESSTLHEYSSEEKEFLLKKKCLLCRNRNNQEIILKPFMAESLFPDKHIPTLILPENQIDIAHVILNNLKEKGFTIENMEINTSVIPNDLFENMDHIKKVKIGSDVRQVCREAFKNFKGQISWDKDSQLRYIDFQAFAGTSCFGDTVILPSTIVYIDANAFERNPVKNIVIPKNSSFAVNNPDKIFYNCQASISLQ